jgi:hypothetical protein
VFNLGRNASWRGGSLVSNREVLRMLSVLFEKHEQPALLYPQDLLDIRSLNLVVTITLKKLFDLVWSKSLMHLGHNLRPPLTVLDYIPQNKQRRPRVIHRVLRELRDFALRAAPLHPRGAGLKSLRSLGPLWITQTIKGRVSTFKF